MECLCVTVCLLCWPVSVITVCRRQHRFSVLPVSFIGGPRLRMRPSKNIASTGSSCWISNRALCVHLFTASRLPHCSPTMLHTLPLRHAGEISYVVPRTSATACTRFYHLFARAPPPLRESEHHQGFKCKPRSVRQRSSSGSSAPRPLSIKRV